MARLELNLAGRPFVNDRPLVAVTAAAAVLLVAFTFFNFHGLFAASRRAFELNRALAEMRGESAAATAATDELVKALSDGERRRIRQVAVATTAMIQKRRLRWTRLFEQLEAVLPRDVRILSVVPTAHDRRILLLLECTARDNGVKLKFYNKLQEPPFGDAYILGETVEEGQKIRFSVRGEYDPDGPDAEPIYEPMPWELARTKPSAAAAAAPTPPPPNASAAGRPLPAAGAGDAAAALPPVAHPSVPAELLGGFADPVPEGGR